MVSSPNFFVVRDQHWVLTGGNSDTLWGQLIINDDLGQRRYLPQGASVLKVVFMRARATQVGGTDQTITKTAILLPEDKSLFRIDLSAQDSNQIISGTVKFELTESGKTTTWNQHYFMVRNLTSQGS